MKTPPKRSPERIKLIVKLAAMFQREANLKKNKAKNHIPLKKINEN